MSMALSGLIDKPYSRAMLEHFEAVYGLTAALVDREGKTFLVRHRAGICAGFHCPDPDTAAPFRKSIIEAESPERTEKAPGTDICVHGFSILSAPIGPAGDPAGRLVVGPFFPEAPDRGLFRRRAAESGFDEIAYLRAVDAVPVLTPREAGQVGALVRTFAGMLSSLGTTSEPDLEEQFRLLLLNSPDLTILQSAQGEVLYLSPQVERILGHTAKEFLGRGLPAFIHAEDLPATVAQLQRALSGQEIVDHEYRFQDSKGEYRWLSHTARPIFIDGRLARIQSTVRDITARVKAEESLKTALQEKDILLRELYHRTKNNLQVIASFMQLQARQTADAAVERIARGMDSRIRAIALVHEKLYFSKNLSRIELGSYIRELTATILKTYGEASERVAVDLALEEVELLIDQAIPCGLVLNELLTNSLRHAFPDGRSGRIDIRLERGEPHEIILRYRDDGVGVASDDVLQGARSVGLKTIFAVVFVQLHGRLHWERGAGLTWTIRFPDTAYGERI